MLSLRTFGELRPGDSDSGGPDQHVHPLFHLVQILPSGAVSRNLGYLSAIPPHLPWRNSTPTVTRPRQSGSSDFQREGFGRSAFSHLINVSPDN